MTTPGGKPVTEEPGETPKSPLTTVGPVLVTVLPPRTAKLAAVPNAGAGAASADGRPDPRTTPAARPAPSGHLIPQRLLTMMLSQLNSRLARRSVEGRCGPRGLRRPEG